MMLVALLWSAFLLSQTGGKVRAGFDGFSITVETSWDTCVYPKCSDSISEPCESLNCYVTFHCLGTYLISNAVLDYIQELSYPLFR